MDVDVVIRSAIPADFARIRTLAVTTGLLTEDEAAQMLGSPDVVDAPAGWLIGVTATGTLVGAAHFGQEPISDRVWNLHFMAVNPTYQTGGVGTALLHQVEDRLRARSDAPANALVIETSSLESFAGARAFYARRGYAQVGQIPNYYGPGDDKVIFWKSFTRPGVTAG